MDSRILQAAAGMIASRFGSGGGQAQAAASPMTDEEGKLGAVENADTSSLSGLAGSAAGAAVGSVFGPAGTATGSTVGGWVGNKIGSAAAAAGQVPGGPGGTIEAGSQPIVTQYKPDRIALQAAQALQTIAVRGMQSKPVPNGRKKVF
jgi:phage tail tape-measure protein